MVTAGQNRYEEIRDPNPESGGRTRVGGSVAVSMIRNALRRFRGVRFLSTALDEALQTVAGYPLSEERLPKRLGSIALDVATTHSLNRPTRGRLALYADAAGGKPLVDWYRSRGMEVLEDEKRLPLVPRRLFRPSDGRYCYYTPAASLRASRELDPLR